MAKGGMCGEGGACVVKGGLHGKGGHAWDRMRYGDEINERAVRILLECILVIYMLMCFIHVPIIQTHLAVTQCSHNSMFLWNFQNFSGIPGTICLRMWPKITPRLMFRKFDVKLNLCQQF